MSTVPASAPEWQTNRKHQAALFDGLIPVLRADDTIAVYGVDLAGAQCDQPLAVFDPFDTSMFATALGALLEQVRRL